MSDFTVEDILIQIAKLPPTEQIRLRHLLAQQLQEPQEPPRPPRTLINCLGHGSSEVDMLRLPVL